MFNIAVRNANCHKAQKIMKSEKNQTIMMLQYQLSRYQAMGNGIMCQNLSREIQRLKNMRTL